MKTELKAKFLQHLLQKKKNNEGFTLIELLVVIIIIGILAAIALPSFLNQANKAKQSEAKTYVGSMNRGQQAYYLENNAFVTENSEFGQLGLGVATQTTNYKYSVATGGGKTAVINRGVPVEPEAPLKVYMGGVSLGEIAETSEATTLATLCEAKKAIGLAGSAQGTESPTFTETKAPECTALYVNASK